MNKSNGNSPNTEGFASELKGFLQAVVLMAVYRKHFTPMKCYP